MAGTAAATLPTDCPSLLRGSPAGPSCSVECLDCKAPWPGPAHISCPCQPCLALARAGCPMQHRDAQRVRQSLEHWYIVMGLHPWAAKQATAATANPAQPSDTSSANGTACSNHEDAVASADSGAIGAGGSQQSTMPDVEQLPMVSEGLMAQLARLPPDMVENIASEAFLSPKQAAKIRIAAKPKQPWLAGT